jgi:hypothetical protein
MWGSAWGIGMGYCLENLAGAKHQIYHTAFAYYANSRTTGQLETIYTWSSDLFIFCRQIQNG